MHLQILVSAVAKDFRSARTEVSEPGDILRGRQGSRLVQMDRGHTCSLKIRRQLAQVHFCFSRLKATFHRLLHPSLVFRSAHTFEEEIGITLNVFGGSESDRVDSTLDNRSEEQTSRTPIKLIYFL